MAVGRHLDCLLRLRAEAGPASVFDVIVNDLFKIENLAVVGRHGAFLVGDPAHQIIVGGHIAAGHAHRHFQGTPIRELNIKVLVLCVLLLQ